MSNLGTSFRLVGSSHEAEDLLIQDVASPNDQLTSSWT